MSLRLLIDEDSQDRLLVRGLRAAGHDVLTVNEANLTTALDEEILAYAARDHRIVVTHNCDDFEALHEYSLAHQGIVAIYESHDLSKNMTLREMVHALGNLEATGLDLAGQFMGLNFWLY